MRATLARITRSILFWILVATTSQQALADQALEDVTDQVRVKAGGFRFDRHSGQYVQAVTIQNHGGKTIEGRLFARLENLGKGIALATGQPATNPVVDIQTRRKEQMFAGETGTTVLRFQNPDNKSIRYQIRIMRARSQ